MLFLNFYFNHSELCDLIIGVLVTDIIGYYIAKNPKNKYLSILSLIKGVVSKIFLKKAE
jgi:hypothetical protein